MLASSAVRRLAWISVALFGLASCVTTTSVVRSRFAKEQSCPVDRVTVDGPFAQRYRAHGCDREATYVCTSTGGFKGGGECVEEGLPNPPGYRDREHPNIAPPDPNVSAPR